MTALGIGLLIGVERERRKGTGPARAPAGIRTFTIAALSGAISITIGGGMLLAVVVAGTIVLTAIGYARAHEDDPGLTGELALILTVLLGALAMQQPVMAGGLAVTVAILLALRVPLHSFVRGSLTETEIKDALIFAAATVVILPLLPDQPIGPYGALNLRTLWIVVILMMAISAAGYIAVRLLGARFGLPLTGYASGFISSTATIGAMGAQAARHPEVLSVAVAGAVLSTVATVVQLALMVAAVSPATLAALAAPLTCAGIAALAYGALFTLHALRSKDAAAPPRGRAFSLSSALTFAAILAAILLASAALRDWFGTSGVLIASAVSGFADAQAQAVSVASLVSAGHMTTAEAVIPILAGFTTNTVSKIIFAATNGGRAFALRVIPGVVIVAAAAWAGTLWGMV
jgi:uncharacterized membrane protein (DUF4010 family)